MWRIDKTMSGQTRQPTIRSCVRRMKVNHIWLNRLVRRAYFADRGDSPRGQFSNRLERVVSGQRNGGARAYTNQQVVLSPRRIRGEGDDRGNYPAPKRLTHVQYSSHSANLPRSNQSRLHEQRKCPHSNACGRGAKCSGRPQSPHELVRRRLSRVRFRQDA
jgi:hypothetical protein